MLGAAARPALVTLMQGPGNVTAADEFWDDDMALPVVSPAEILTLGGKVESVRFTVDQMITIGEMRTTNDSWLKILMSLRDREGTVLDVTREMLEYEDQESLRSVRHGVLDVYTSHVFCALHGTSTWPTTLSVESWLRDCLMSNDRGRSQKAALILWCIVVSRAVGEEAIRDVVRAVHEWFSFSEFDAACSRGGTECSAKIALVEARLYKEHLWVKVLSNVERASADAFWDWRRADLACHVHGCGLCPNAGKPRMEYVMRAGCK